MSTTVQPVVELADVHRTPDERFEGLPDFPYRPHYREWEGIRLAHVDVGDGPPVVMLHGEPSWSYLYRKVIPPLVAGGHRCIAPDLPGFGRSDKPTDESWYSFERHTDAISSLLDDLDLRDVCLVMHDWGGPIGLRVAMLEAPERVGRLVVMDAGVLTGEQEMGPAWRSFRDLVAAVPDLPIGRMVRLGCRRKPTAEVIAAYDAPFPSSRSKAGVRAFPRLVPLSPDAPGAAAGRETLEALRADRRPTLLLWADADPMFPLDRFASEMHEQLGRRCELEAIANAGHFLQEDRGEQIGARIAAWLRSQGPEGCSQPTKSGVATGLGEPAGDPEIPSTPPASHATLTFERTIERRLVHKRSLDEVFVTDLRIDGDDDPGAMAALLPRSHGLHCELRDGHHDLLMLFEICRQGMTLFGHGGLEVPPDTAFVMASLEAEIVDLDATRLGDGPSQMTILVPPGVASHKRGRLRSYTMRGFGYIDERLALAGWATAILIPRSLYERARRVTIERPLPAATPPAPVAPRRVGRNDPRNVVVGETREEHGRFETSVIVDPTHPGFFDHELDHVPGMLMLEAARQTAMLAVAREGWDQPASVTPDRCEARLTRYAALAPPAVCSAEVEADDDLDPPARTVRVSFSQCGQDLGHVILRLRRLVPAVGAR